MLHVVIVGGGPAGLIAAETLASAGVRATVIERAPDRLPPCAGLLTQPAMAALGIPELLLAQRVDELAVYSPTSRVAFVPLAAVPGSVSGSERFVGVMRRELLQTLLRRRAEEAGATLVHAAFRRFVQAPGDYPILELVRPDGTREQLAADVVIGADGVASRVARAIGLPPLDLGVVYTEKLSLPPGAVAPGGMQVHFGRKVSADRYGWLVPHLDHLTLGVSTHRRYGKRVHAMLAELKKRLGSQLDGAKPMGRASYMIPLEQRPVLAHERVLLVGDAAGVTAPTTYDGLYHAAMSGRIAAETILAHRHMPTPENLAGYDARFQRAHGAALAAVAKLERIFFVNDKRREALVDLAWDRQIQRAAIDAFIDKKPLTAPFKVMMKIKTRMAASLLKHSLGGPRRGEGDLVGRAMPAGENYLDLALRQPASGLATLPPLREVLGEGLIEGPDQGLDEDPAAAGRTLGADEPG